MVRLYELQIRPLLSKILRNHDVIGPSSSPIRVGPYWVSELIPRSQASGFNHRMWPPRIVKGDLPYSWCFWISSFFPYPFDLSISLSRTPSPLSACPDPTLSLKPPQKVLATGTCYFFEGQRHFQSDLQNTQCF